MGGGGEVIESTDFVGGHYRGVWGTVTFHCMVFCVLAGKFAFFVSLRVSHAGMGGGRERKRESLYLVSRSVIYYPRCSSTRLQLHALSPKVKAGLR